MSRMADLDIFVTENNGKVLLETDIRTQISMVEFEPVILSWV